MLKGNIAKGFIAVILFLSIGIFVTQRMHIKNSSANSLDIIEDSKLISNISSEDQEKTCIVSIEPKNTSSNANSKINNLELPEALDRTEISEAIRQIEITLLRTKMEETWKPRYAAMSEWPLYPEEKGYLEQHLLKFDIENLSAEEIVKISSDLRENFWDKGGCLSTTSYQEIYLARALLEKAHTLKPDSMAIIDELVETIQTAYPIVHHRNYSKKVTPIIDIVNQIVTLRKKQFIQSQQEILEGRKPTLDDFIRACDLIYLQQKIDAAEAREVVLWLQDKASEGGWEGYSQTLAELEKFHSQGRSYGFNIYVSENFNSPEDLKYSLRLPSFKGPKERKTFLWGIPRSVPLQK